MARVRSVMKNFSPCNKHFGKSRARRLADITSKNGIKGGKCGPGGCSPGGGCGPGGCSPTIGPKAKDAKC